MISVVDEQLSGDPKYRILDNGGNVIYDNLTIEQITPITTAGTPLNKALFDSIASDINNRILISSKASTEEAQEGTNDSKYMTPKKVAEYMDFARGIHYTGIDLSTGANTIDLTSYLTSDTKKLEIIINCNFRANYQAIELQGTGLKNGAGDRNGGSSRKLGNINYVYNAVGRISLYPEIHTYEALLIGQSYSGASSGTASDMNINETGGFNTLTNLVVGYAHSTGTTSTSNYGTQLGIYQYLK